MWRAVVMMLILLMGCGPGDKVPPAFSAHDWRLSSINGTPYPQTVTMDLRPSGLVIGRTPCNRFGGFLSRWPVGWEFGPLGLQGAPCPAGNAEAAFIAALTQVTRSEVVGTRLELRGPGVIMIFDRLPERRRPP